MHYVTNTANIQCNCRGRIRMLVNTFISASLRNSFYRKISTLIFTQNIDLNKHEFNVIVFIDFFSLFYYLHVFPPP